MNLQRKLYTVRVYAKLNTRRYFRDKTAIFFTVAFPLIFLFVFGGIFGKNSDLSFKVALLNESKSQFAGQFTDQTKHSKLFKVNDEITNLDQARDKMNHGEIDAAIVLPGDFGTQKTDQKYPSGQAVVYYTQNNQQAAQTLTSVLQEEFKSINTKFVKVDTPFTVTSKQSGDKGLSQFDYTFAGLLGFSILGLGIFGPINVFPELKKQGVLRRFHTTPIRVWQFFLANMISQATIGLFTMTIMFATAIAVFHLKVVGNYVTLAAYLAFGIVLILGIGLALGGWAKNERQAAPLGNLVTFPMMFLSGTFFPRYLMPEWLQHITNYLPLTPVIDGVRLIATEGKGLLDLGPQLAVMTIWMIVIYFIAFRVFRWE
jgi:ABC-2 type transport system permease protein